MRLNLTKSDIVNSIYMQVGYSKNLSENLVEDVFEIILQNLIKYKKVKLSQFGTFILKKRMNE